MARFREMPDGGGQGWLYARSLDDLLASDSDVRLFREVMDRLDYRGLEASYASVGRPAYPPKVMAQLLVYAYSKGHRSSRRIEELAKNDVRLMWLAGGLKPDHHTVARFRRDRFNELSELFADSVRICAESGLMVLRVAAVDGSKLEANVSRRSIYDSRRVGRELRAVEEILREAEAVDEAEDCEDDGKGSEIPDGLKDAKERKARLDEIAGRLKQSKRRCISSSDVDCRMMKTRRGVRACFNVQAVVDGESQVIAGVRVTDAEHDHGQLVDVVKMAKANSGVSPGVVIADTGYSDEQTLRDLDASGQDALIPVQKHSQEDKRRDLFSSRCFVLDAERDVVICPAGRDLVFKDERKRGSGVYRRYAAKGCRSCSFQRECCRGRASRTVSMSVVHSLRERMRQKLSTAEGKAVYALRRQSVEAVFGQIKSNLGFNRFLLRGKDGASAEIAVICLAHNIGKCVRRALQHALLAVFGSDGTTQLLIPFASAAIAPASAY